MNKSKQKANCYYCHTLRINPYASIHMRHIIKHQIVPYAIIVSSEVKIGSTGAQNRELPDVEKSDNGTKALDLILHGTAAEVINGAKRVKIASNREPSCS